MLAVDIVNTWDELHTPKDLIEDLADVRYLLEWHGLSAAAGRGREPDVQRLRDIRDRFAAVFDAGDEEDAARLVNALVRDYGRPPQLERVAGAWRLRSWPDECEGLDAAAAFAAVGLLEALRDLGWSRFGRCNGLPCSCAFIDRSRNRSRRYCCELCATRVAQASSRARRGQRPA